MKKKVVIFISVLICIVVAFLVFLYAGRAGGEIGFGATINRVEDGIAYATVTDDDTGFGAKKLPESIMFEVADLGIELQAGDIIRGCYMRGTINGQFVRVVSVRIITD
jgi:hypothetical protein